MRAGAARASLLPRWPSDELPLLEDLSSRRSASTRTTAPATRDTCECELRSFPVHILFENWPEISMSSRLTLLLPLFPRTLSRELLLEVFWCCDCCVRILLLMLPVCCWWRFLRGVIVSGSSSSWLLPPSTAPPSRQRNSPRLAAVLFFRCEVVEVELEALPAGDSLVWTAPEPFPDPLPEPTEPGATGALKCSGLVNGNWSKDSPSE